MSLLDLPAELRLRIYDYLPELCSSRPTVNSVHTTPAICRTSRQLHYETVPIYARNSRFLIQTDASTSYGVDRTTLWLRALGPCGIEHVRDLQLNCHWQIDKPNRWAGHVGFYVRLEKADHVWRCTTGTYPVSKDIRGMRQKSVELLRKTVLQNVLNLVAAREKQGLVASDVELILEAMQVVGSHSLPASDMQLEHRDILSARSRSIWQDMDRRLLALTRHCY